MKLIDYYEAKRPRSYETSWHHRWTCDVLERGVRERKNVILEQPPRHGKSEIANMYMPAWRLNEGPFDSHFGLVCNSDNLGQKFSSGCKSLMDVPLSVDRDSQWKIAADLSLDYSYRATGIRGQITGWGFDTLILDDLLKSGQEAKSDTVRNTVYENVVSAGINRLTPNGIVIIEQARLHQDDPIGRLLQTTKFLRLHLPAINFDGGSAWFEDMYSGERIVFPAYDALWPTQFSAEKLLEIKERVHEYYWNAQYQQTPSMGSLAYFDVEKMPSYQYPNCDLCWIAVDAAQTETATGSYTAFVALGFAGRELKVLAVRRGRWRQDVMHEQLIAFNQEIGRMTGLMPSKIIVEQAAGGYGIVDMLSHRLPIEPIYPRGSKEDRAAAVCYVVNRGQVSLPTSAPWLEPFKREIADFPLCSAKDQTDAFVHALSFATRPGEFKPVDQSSVVVYDADRESFDGGLDIGGDDYVSALDSFEEDEQSLPEVMSDATRFALERFERNRR